jgi:hypothetical protein
MTPPTVRRSEVVFRTVSFGRGSRGEGDGSSVIVVEGEVVVVMGRGA